MKTCYSIRRIMLFVLVLSLPSALWSQDSSARNLFESGNKQLKEEKFADAIAYYTGAIQADAQFAKAYTRRGAAKRNKGDSTGALEDLNRAIELDPKDGEAYFNRGLIAANRKDTVRGLDDLDRAIELEPKNGDVYYARAMVKSMKADTDGAIEDLNRVVDLDPKNLEAYQARGEALVTKNDLEGAIADFTHILQLARNSATYYARGVARAAKGDQDGAISDFGQILGADPDDVRARFQRGIAKADKHDSKNALADLQKVFEVKPSDDVALRIWLVRAQLGERPAATKDLTAYLAKRPTGTGVPRSVSIGRFLAGQMTEVDIVKLAESSTTESGKEFLCQVYFYAGAVRLLEKDKPGAADRFKKSIATGKAQVREYASAAAEIKLASAKR